MAGDRQVHWENVYSTKGENEVSWFQENPALSMELLQLVGAKPDDAIVDIGGGASRLVDKLCEAGFAQVTVLDLSEAALASARNRLGDAGRDMTWIAADVTEWEPPRQYAVWHDRAAFHFLTSDEEQQAYVERLNRALAVGGHVIIGTFAPDGPEKCSGLPVARQDSESVAKLLGPYFELIDSRRHEHHTPWESVQKFQFSTFRRAAC